MSDGLPSPDTAESEYECQNCGDVVPTTGREPPLPCLNCDSDRWERVHQ